MAFYVILLCVMLVNFCFGFTIACVAKCNSGDSLACVAQSVVACVYKP